MFHNIHEVAAAVFEIERGEPNQVKVAERIGAELSRRTPGLGIVPLGTDMMRAVGYDFIWGVMVTGTVDGTDIKMSSDPLMFPFDAKAFWAVCGGIVDGINDAKAEWEAQGPEGFDHDY
jgi:hypothetical protein